MVKIRDKAQGLVVCFFHHGFRERSIVMFTFDLTLAYFVSFVTTVILPLSAFLMLMSVFCFNSINAWSLRDKLHFGFAISISARCGLTSSR